MGKLREILRVFLIFGVMVFPLKSQAEAEHIYVSWIDIDYMESNPLLGWLEDVKYQIANVSPFIGQFLLAEDDISDLEEERFIAEGEVSLLKQ